LILNLNQVFDVIGEYYRSFSFRKFFPKNAFQRLLIWKGDFTLSQFTSLQNGLIFI